MYVNPALLPQVSNREDFLKIVQLYDDDTGEPIDLHNFTTATTQEFTGSDWGVTIGEIVTESETEFTIPQLPSSGELSTLAITVETGLDVSEGDPIQIYDNADSRNTCFGYVVSYAAATGALVAQIGFTFQFEIRKIPPDWQPGFGYTTFYDLGTAPQSPILQASLANGEIYVIDLGTIQVRIPESVFKTLTSGTYGVFMTATNSYDTRQIFVGRLPVIWGGVSN